MIAPFGIRPKGTLAARMLPLAQALAGRGHGVRIVAPPVQNPEDAGSRVWHGDVEVIHTPLPGLPGPVAALDQARMLLREALAGRPDLVHLFKPKGFGGLAVLRRPPGLPLVVDTDDWEGPGGWNDLLPYPRWAKWLFAWQERDLPRRAAAVTVVSRTLERQVLGFGVEPGRIFYLPNGMADRPPGAGPARGDGRTIVLYTRFWEFRLDALLAALRGIAAERPDVRLLVVGRGERGEEQELLRRAEGCGLHGTIDYRGWVEPHAIPGMLAQADLALVPIEDTLLNRARGLAKLLELMQAGLPIVASRVGQVSEYLSDQESGLLAPPGDSSAMASLAVRALGDRALRERLGAGALARSELFAWSRLAEVAEAAYARALG